MGKTTDLFEETTDLFEKTTNLLEETLNVLNSINKTENDILWVSNTYYNKHTTWEIFKDIIKDINYQGFYEVGKYIEGITQGLIICGDNWWLERSVDDYGESWIYRELPKKPEKYTLLTKENILL